MRPTSRSLIAACSLAALLASRRTHAQSLSWTEAVARAERASPRVIADAARVEETRRGEDVATMLPNPTVAVGSYAESSRLYASLLMPMPIWGSVGLAGDAARARTAEADAQRRVTRLDVGVTALSAWVDVWSARAQLRAAEANTARLERLAEAVRDLASQGQRPRLDVVTASGELSSARADEAAARHNLDAARAMLAVAIGAPSTASPDVDGEPPGEDEAPPLAAVLDASANNPSLEALHHRAEGAVADQALERRLRIPTPALQVWAYLLRVSNPPADVYVGLAFELPIFNQRSPLIERAHARELTARADAEANEAQLRAQARAAWTLFEGARERAHLHLTEALPAANEAAELAQEAYRAGRLDLTGLLAAEQRRLLAQTRADQAVADRARALAALRRAMGGAR